MDMDMGHMHGAAGIDSGLNHAFARDYWYIAAGIVGLLVAVRAVNHYGAVQRRKACTDPSITHATCSRPGGRLGQAWATATALIRETGHPQLLVTTRGLAWATPPPLGRVLVLLGYWAVIAYMMSSEAILDDAYYWERIGYRNAWVSLMQLPALYLLAMKCNPVGWLIGAGHERLNWLHRWVARTMLVTATVHGFHFWTEWALADFVAYELAIMPLVKYGLAAWAVLLWSVVVGFVPVRRLAYEVWLLQHVLSAAVMLWLLHRHIPANARYLLFMAISFLIFDRVARCASIPYSSSSRSAIRFGHEMSMRAVGGTTTILTIRGTRFKWHAGQHVYLWVPRLGPLEAHPYTIACAHELSSSPAGCNSIQLIVRAHGGFSKRIHARASRHPEKTFTAFLSGPFGVPPQWDTYETLVLISASTGASFTIPMLEAAAASSRRTCVRRIEVALIARMAGEIEFYVRRAMDAAKLARDRGIDVRLHVAITGSGPEGDAGVPLVQLRRNKRDSPDVEKAGRAPGPSDGLYGRRSSSISSVDSNACLGDSRENASGVGFRQYAARPDLETLIREPVEQAWGETGVIVCGGRELAASTRNCVSRLSDERAVHKGTGAQGISLYVEEYAL
ncbi:ferric reductase like transmembrane component domain-containing protein [Hirsutella rhossiliensis]|uniref:ferric-chelate reductase (NADPH) n=1 Tax=Hirsutella rhossiliensis TaxID=111463 RepID=A0A9P8N552_9HYPO|nr:ferric reductase like transmembrane component domain-containing protein [Hirsutella rhossiliensis]KAH0966116.1 ferric reductase like transmembrane component domain-containing protein [Hirsutella rhossiliensis]